jgi:hypothetical protein
MGAVQQLAVAIALFLAFAFGLNLGLHGVVYFLDSGSVGLNPVESAQDSVSAIIRPKDTIATKSDIDKMNSNRNSASGRDHSEAQVANVHNSIPSNIYDQSKQEFNAESEGLVDKISKIESSLYSRIDSTRFSASLMNAYKNTPIVLLTCNRPELLRETIGSLLKVRGLQKDQILIIQDGNMAEIASIAKENNLTLVQNLSGLRLRGGAGTDGASRIAQHYKFALSTGFDRFASANAVIVVEDDLLFSPDFYEYLTSVAPILDIDKSAFVVSAWNDNGFHDKVKEPFAIRRTEFFPGLGWILPRKLYKGELEAKWPIEHWDHWLRSPETHRNRESIYPQIPRTYHNGVRGTFMDESTHNRYFRDIHNNRDESINWNERTTTVSHLSLATQDNYEKRVEEMIKHQCTHVESLGDLFSDQKDRILCLWINIATEADYNPPFETVGRFFGIWHEHKRGNHKGLHEFYFEDNYILLLNIHESVLNSNYHTWKPTNIHVFGQEYFTNRQALMSMQSSKIHNKVYRASAAGQSCDMVCQNNGGKMCKANLLPYANNCDMLQQHFPCVHCSGSLGAEQPAYVREEAGAQSLPRHCLFNQDTRALPITCGAFHPDTLRLCVCE